MNRGPTVFPTPLASTTVTEFHQVTSDASITTTHRTLLDDLQASNAACQHMFGAMAGSAISGPSTPARTQRRLSLEGLELEDELDEHDALRCLSATASRQGTPTTAAPMARARGGDADGDVGTPTSDCSFNSTSDGSDWMMDNYRQQRMNEIMMGGSAQKEHNASSYGYGEAGDSATSGSCTPMTNSFALSNSGQSTSAIPSTTNGSGNGVPHMSDERGRRMGRAAAPGPSSGDRGRSRSASRRRTNSNPPVLGTGGSRRLVLSIDQLELCKRVDQELRKLQQSATTTAASGGGAATQPSSGAAAVAADPHLSLSALDKQYVIRAVHCKKTLDKAVKLCLAMGPAIFDRFGLDQLRPEDVAPVLARKALLRIDPTSGCAHREDGSSLFYVVASRLLHPSTVEPEELVRATLFVLERTRAFEGRVTFVVDLRSIEPKANRLKQWTDLGGRIREAVEGKYPLQVARILLLLEPSTGTINTMMWRGAVFKSLSSKWRDRTKIVTDLSDQVQGLAAMRRELYEKLEL